MTTISPTDGAMPDIIPEEVAEMFALDKKKKKKKPKKVCMIRITSCHVMSCHVL
jgi:hypothetical protein